VSETTVHLEPGHYMLECYVKTDGVFHSYNPDPDVYGMVTEFTVTADSTATSRPAATLAVIVSGEDGFQVEGTPTAGRQTVAVRFRDQTVHENFVGHDIHVARLEDDTDMDALQAWMDWTQPAGLQTPAPVEFLGGLEEMPATHSGYFTVTLEPGRYAFIAEVPHAGDKGLLQTFEVPAG
jgi:hypothetical protein